MPNSVKTFYISSAIARVAPDLLKALTILSDTNVRRSSVAREGSKPCGKLEKNPHFSRWLKCLLFTSFSKTLLTTERKLTGRYFLAVDLSPTFLNTGTTDETFQQFGKQDSFRQILNSSAKIYESSGSQFFRTTTGMLSESGAFDKLRFFMNFWIIFGVLQKYYAIWD